MASIQIANLHKRYGDVSVLKSIDFSIDDGEFVVLVGPSGCGKSTLLRVISGLESITSGEIQIGGQVVNTLPAKDRDIAMVFQNYALYPHMTVADNMGFSMKMRGEKKDAIKARVDGAAAILGLEPLMQRRPSQLSGGQRQRVAMGRAIVRDPKVFLFDEPLSNLDAKLRVQMRTEIKALHQRLKTTMVYVTHDQIEAMTMADRIVVMRDGIVEQIGQPLELYDRPKNTFVASFIGSPGMNLIEGVITAGADPSFEIADGMQISLPTIQAEWSGRRCIYGIRPEDLALHPEGIAASVVAVEPTGPETHALVRVGEHTLTCVLRERTHIKVGQTVRVKPQVEKAHLFDAVSGDRLEVRPTPSTHINAHPDTRPRRRDHS